MDSIERIAELAKEKSWQEITETYILPEVLKSSGSARNYQISDEFMTVVAEYAQIMYHQDRTTMELLLEFAMQRISCGGVKHHFIGAALNVQQKYAHYATLVDKPAPMSEACWDFLMRGFPYALISEKLKRHSRAILFGLIFNLDYQTGAPTKSLDLKHISATPSEVKNWAWKTAECFIPFEEFWPKLVTDNWTKYKPFFSANWNRIDLPKFHKAVVANAPVIKVWEDLALDGWQRHIGFFHDYWYSINKKRFFEVIGVKNLLQQTKISLKIRHYSP